ncbi:MAG: alpha/beta fold hydrolase, partial [Deltaproteobacteria bacterium]|nr:alpha/beta fold hydrolase [Deltaproteobacteria bacterium]
TLVVAGDADRLTPPHHAEALAAAIPGARRATIHGAGHLAYLESPTHFAAEVLGFLHGEGREASTCPRASTPW